MERTCQLCHYKWPSRFRRKPKQCPRCKRYDWELKEVRQQQSPISETVKDFS